MSCNDCSCAPGKPGPCKTETEPAELEPTDIEYVRPDTDDFQMKASETRTVLAVLLDVAAMIRASQNDTFSFDPFTVSIASLQDALWEEFQLQAGERRSLEQAEATNRKLEYKIQDLEKAKKVLASEIVDLRDKANRLKADCDAAAVALRMVDAARMLKEMFPDPTDRPYVHQPEKGLFKASYHTTDCTLDPKTGTGCECVDPNPVDDEPFKPTAVAKQLMQEEQDARTIVGACVNCDNRVYKNEAVYDRSKPHYGVRLYHKDCTPPEMA